MAKRKFEKRQNIVVTESNLPLFPSLLDNFEKPIKTSSEWAEEVLANSQFGALLEFPTSEPPPQISPEEKQYIEDYWELQTRELNDSLEDFPLDTDILEDMARADMSEEGGYGVYDPFFDIWKNL